MKFKILLLSVCTGILAAGLWYAGNGTNGEVANAYTPRGNQGEAGYAQGAFEYYRSVRSNVYTGEIEPEDVLRMRSAVKKMGKNSKNGDVNWAFMGPDNVGGRTRAILPFPNDVNTMIAGGVSGGLFKTTNGGQTWSSLPSFDDNLIVGSIAMLGNGAIYVGTGHSREGFPNGTGGSDFIGGGLFLSTDQGATWNLVNDFEPQAFDSQSDWANINVLLADPSNDNRLWIGTNFGFFPFIHGSSDLEPLPNGLINSLTQDAAISADGENLIVTLGTRTYVSTDFGANFEQVNNNVLTTQGNGATDLDISPYNKNLMFASVPSPQGFLKGIYATTNAGQTWNTIAPASNPLGNNPSPFAPFYNGLTAQGNYDNMITTVRGVEGGGSEVIMGGIRLYKYVLPENTTPGIFAWENINANFASSPGSPPSPFYVHSDIHTAAWDVDDRLYIGCDGGIFRSTDRGVSWADINRNYTTTQFYAIAFTPSGQVLGGTQDNGSLWLSLQGATPGQAVQFTGGDGFDCEISQEFPDFMFSTLYNGTVFRSATGGQNVTTMESLTAVSGGGGNDFFTDIALHENANNQFSEIFQEFIPAGDDPYLQYFEDGVTEVTADGDTIIAKIPAGTEIVVEADNSDFLLTQVTQEDINFYSYYVREVDGQEFVYHNVADTLLIQETPQFMLAAALSNGVYLSRQPLKTNGTPQFTRIALGEGASPTSIEFSPDGDHLYVGYANGRLVKYSGLNSAWTPDQLTLNNPQYALTKSTIHNGQGAITDIEVDWSLGQGTNGVSGPASERVVITEGNYGGSGKVKLSNTAASATGTGSFVNIWNVDDAIEGMPCYSIVMDVNNPSKMMVGTEYGIWYTDNEGDSWSNANNGDMVRVPVFDLRQQKRPIWQSPNSGVVYAGSHGRGIFRTDYLASDPLSTIDIDTKLPAVGDLKVFPNPMKSNGTVQFDLGVSGDVSMRIFSLNGQLVKAIAATRMEPGAEQQLTFDVNDLTTGTYILQLTVNGINKTAKFIKTK